MSLDNYITLEDGNTYWHEDIFECHWCSGKFPKDEVNISSDGDDWCNDCYSRKIKEPHCEDCFYENKVGEKK